MTFYQKGGLALIALGATLLASCSSSTKSTPVAPVSHPLHIAYTAIGASDAVGFGASVPCTTASPALGAADPTCPEAGASGYVPDILRGFAQVGFIAALQDLGISGAVIGPDIQATGNMFDSFTGANACQPRPPADQIPANFLQAELPVVNPNATFITIFAGGNDTNAIVNALVCGAGGATTASQTAFITAQITAFGHDFATLVGGAHQLAPNATIVVANLPNFADIPFALQAPAAVREALQIVSVGIDTNVINTVVANGVPVVDLLCNPASYDPANFFTDGFHPNDAGYALLAQQFLQAALSNNPAPPQAQCAEEAITTSALRQAVPVGRPLNTYLKRPLR
jgi:lysophospholipase L1-like esterase